MINELYIMVLWTDKDIKKTKIYFGFIYKYIYI